MVFILLLYAKKEENVTVKDNVLYKNNFEISMVLKICILFYCYHNKYNREDKVCKVCE